MNIIEIGAVILENTKTGRKYRDDLANFDTCPFNLVLPRKTDVMNMKFTKSGHSASDFCSNKRKNLHLELFYKYETVARFTH